MSEFETVSVSSYKWLLFVSEYLSQFNCVQTIVMIVCKQIYLDSFKNKITDKLFIYKSYLWKLNCMQTNNIWFF